MKPEYVCLIVKNTIGLQIVRIFPELLFKRKLRNLPRVSLPYGAMEGDFISSKIDKYFFASYIFFIPSNENAIPASLTAVFKQDSFNPEKIKSFFKKSIAILRENHKGELASIANSLPDFYQDYHKDEVIVKSSTTTSILIGSDKNKKVNRKENPEKNTKQIDDDIWFDDE